MERSLYEDSKQVKELEDKIMGPLRAGSGPLGTTRINFPEKEQEPFVVQRG